MGTSGVGTLFRACTAGPIGIPKIYTDENAARKHLEKLQWPDGPQCPHCGVIDEATLLKGKSTRAGVYKCRACEKPFSVTVGTVFEDSKVPLHKWLYATHLLTASKKGFSSHQLHRTLGVSYKTAWFMSHRIRESMRTGPLAPMGGAGEIVEIDETVIGRIEGAPKHLKTGMGWSWRNIVLTLVTREGSARSFHVGATTHAQLLPIIRANIQRETAVMTDDASWYKLLGDTFASHESVNHSEKEYVRREFTPISGGVQVHKIHTNTVEGFYSIFKRGMKGIYQHCSEKHLHRYLAEFDFRYSNRVKLGVNDAMRADKALEGMSPAWSALLAKLPKRREGVGLSRLARFASAQGIAPQQIDDAALAGLIDAVREGSLHRQPNVLHRRTAQIWNEAAGRPGIELRKVTVPSFRPAPKRINWEGLSDEFRRSVDDHLAWCSGADVFAVDARARPLAARTIALRRGQVHAAVTALLTAGIEPSAITSLADLVTPAALKLILLQRYNAANGRANAYNRDLAEALVQIAREWVKVDSDALAQLKKLAAKMPMPPTGLTDKNKRFLRQFDDPAVLQRLHQLPGLLWAEVRTQVRPNFRTLAKAQGALALSILSYMPLRLQNLAALTFDVHLFVQAAAHAISSLEIPAAEVKNKSELAFDIPRHIVKMLVEYRERIAPKIIGHRPERLFVNADGSPKSPSTVAWLIVNYAKRRAGIILTPHQFRHLSAKVMLDAEPGSFETVKQVLGHQDLKTTVGAYAGVDSRRAARHHQHLIEQTLAAGKNRHRVKASRGDLRG